MYCSVFSKAFSLFLCKGAIPSVVLSKKIAFSFSLSLSCRTFASMKIGNVEFGPYPVFLAPMEDVTDIGFRLLCKRFGAAMVYSEFVAADALVRMVNRSLEKLAVCDDVAIICNEEGKVRGLPLNRAVYVQDNDKKEMVDIICGKFFICYAPPESESFQSLPDDMIKKYKEQFKYPERFSKEVGGNIVAEPFKPKSKDYER